MNYLSFFIRYADEENKSDKRKDKSKKKKQKILSLGERKREKKQLNKG